MPLEQEVKLVFATVEAARQAVLAAGARLEVPRRLLDDQLFDTADERLRHAGHALRLRRDGHAAWLTFKGTVRPGPVKTREEIEVRVDDAAVAEALLVALGYRAWFRAQKFREEYDLDAATVTVDETPIGVFVEIEGAPEAIARVARRLGRSEADYRLESYPRLYHDWCAARGRPAGNMVFDPDR